MRIPLFSALFLLVLAAGGQGAPSQFDGTWNTTVSCDAKGKTLGYTWRFTSTVANGDLRGERGTEGEQGYLLLTGKIGADGSARLTASGITASTAYTHGPFVQSGEQYSYGVKAHFTDANGTGERNTGLGIYGRPCHYVFDKQTAPAGTARP